MKSINLSLAVVLIISLCIMSQPAHAYIDPGTGSMILQALIAGFIAVGAMWAGIKARIMQPFWKKKGSENAEEDEETDT